MSTDPEPRAFRIGMEVAQPTSFTPPEVRPGPPERERYRAPRFSRPVRILITIGIWVIPGLLMMQALGQVLTGGGHSRAAAVLFLLPLIPMAPLLRRAMHDLWGWE
ncbi:MAG TPA: hypothetical protein VFX15_03590 [Actinomycetes bacterium]|nr:hypothetical protein [Actinomycetes bacterium]